VSLDMDNTVLSTNTEKARYTALTVISKFPHPCYWESLVKLFDITMRKQQEVSALHPDTKHHHLSAALDRTFALLIKAVAAFKNEPANTLISAIVVKEFNTSIPALKHFHHRMLRWIALALQEIEDDNCFFLELMHIISKQGILPLRLIQRIFNFDKKEALAWMCDVQHPIICLRRQTSTSLGLDDLDDPLGKRLAWVLSTIVENTPPNKIDVICHYTINANYKTCAIANEYAVMFKEDPRIKKALFYQLARNSHGNVVTEALKALLSFSDPEIDRKITRIIKKRKKHDKHFDKVGECDRLLEHKPRNYPYVDNE